MFRGLETFADRASGSKDEVAFASCIPLQLKLSSANEIYDALAAAVHAARIPCLDTTIVQEIVIRRLPCAKEESAPDDWLSVEQRSYSHAELEPGCS